MDESCKYPGRCAVCGWYIDEHINEISLTLEQERVVLPGYRKPFSECSGYKVAKKDFNDVAFAIARRIFFEESCVFQNKNRYHEDYTELIKKAKQILKKYRPEWSKEESKPSVHLGGCHTYMSFDPRTGKSSVAFGE